MGIWGEKIYVPAIMGASGITEEQAKTCLYYAVATYLIPNRLKIMPILAIIGPLGTGKTSLLNQLLTMVNEPELILAESTPTLRDKLSKTTTACIKEGDTVDEELIYCARELNPEYPGIFDVSAWEIGRYWCRPSTDDLRCAECYLDKYCPKIL